MESSHGPRFDRDAWLRAALAVLTRDGQAKLNIEKIAADLGVTKGSFYHHFRNRGDFVRSIVDFWAEEFTYQPLRILRASPRSAAGKLLQIMEAINESNLNRFDAAFRSWAAQDPSVADVVRQVDTARHRAIGELFADMGFTDDELRERTRIFLVFHSAQSTVHIPEDTALTNETISRRFRFFTGLDADVIGRSADTPPAA
ncbi:TetR/AcrR family transcriptional regulator [Tropicimonas marinistellae]|uniref:TetR/AcrR family transcriptional regulator n=1 Tax=Tropicimonas marinistellae TaxID=1739787 RepID=UPI00082AA8BE|nr:TetR/AcrR family transcriptional regulator [Tropicimonas marinistellae]